MKSNRKQKNLQWVKGMGQRDRYPVPPIFENERKAVRMEC
jgi:hypothetical protein